MKKHSFIIDSLKTIISTLLIAFSLQLLAYPTISHALGNEEFGKILSAYTIITISSVIVGNTLNNIRMINIKSFKDNLLYLNFIKLIVISMVIESVILIFLFLELYQLSVVITSWLLIINILMIIRIYMSVFFRIKLQYNKILLAAIFQFIGLTIGLVIFKVTHFWVVIFLMSEISVVLYTIYTLRHLRLSKVKSHKNIISEYVNLLISNGLNNLNIYLDRIILLPLIGGGAVALSFLATFIGKIFASFMYPINNVILSYISVKNTDNKIKQYLIVNFYGLILSGVIIVISYPITVLIVEYLYRQDSAQVQPYIIVGNIGVFFGVIATMIQTLNTKYISINKQTRYITIHTIIYIVLTIIATWKLEILGFFIMTVLANLLKIILLTVIGIKDSKVAS
ncbi:capsular biosynthesis protein [Staphylococcus canis]|uniref:Capsular biosynthesis protein n=1 Tax=Staphylococcus canis TaxID=2724942 RepID=A0ABS0TA16_9STAP|nr:capsular biosynthesis protein [Staphylococcus canis]MBI5975585.1 capsular biosynthesis protein [Staphylococcus canis]